MNIETKFYWRKPNLLCGSSWRKAKLKPTGRWKMVYNGYNEEPIKSYYTLYIEHKGFLFKTWVSEDEIMYMHYGEIVNKC